MPTTPFTTLREYAPYVSPYNIDLIKEVALYKQSQVDANRAAINEQMDLLMGQDIVKAEDREYLQDRMQDTIGRINTMYYGADLSSDGIVRHIQSEISSVLDDKVMNAISGTREYRRMTSTLQKMQEKGESTYSDINAYVAMKPAYAWLNDGQAGTALGTLVYTPYVDYKAEVADYMKNISKSRNGTTITYPLFGDDGQPTGRMVTVKSDYLTSTQAEEAAMASLSPGARRQMQIEAEYLADSQPGAFSIDAARSYMSTQLANTGDYIRSLEAKKAGLGGDKERLEAIDEEIERAKNSMSVQAEAIRNLNPETYSPYTGALAIVEGQFRMDAARLYAYDNSSYEYSSDTAYWESVKARDRELDRAIKLQQLQNSSKGGSGSGSGGEDPLFNTATQIEQTIDMSKMNINLETEKNYKDRREGFNMAVIKMENALLPEDLEAIRAEIRRDIEENPDTSPYAGKEPGQQLITYFTLNGGASNEMLSRAKDSSGNVNAYRAYNELLDANANFDIERDRIVEEAKARDENMDFIVDKYYNGDMATMQEDAGDYVATYIAEQLISSINFSRDPAMMAESSTFFGLFHANSKRLPYESAVRIAETLQPVWDMAAGDGSSVSGIFTRDEDGRVALKPVDDGSLTEAQRQLVQKVGEFFVPERSQQRNLCKDGANKFERAYFNDKDIAERINDIRVNYIRQYAPLITTIPANVPKDNVLHEASTRAENIYAVRLREQHKTAMPSGSTVTGYNIVAVGKGTNGETQFRMWPSVADTNHDNPYGDRNNGALDVIISMDDAMQLGLPIDTTDNNIPIGLYDTGVTPVTFADVSNTTYAESLDYWGIGAEYADKGNATALARRRISEILPVQNADALGRVPVTTEMNTALSGIVKTIFDNAGYFGVSQKGYDTRTSFYNGVETNLYILNPKNKAARPEKIAGHKTNEVLYADRLNTEFRNAPQKVFAEYIISLAEAEAYQMLATGRYELPGEDSELMKIYNRVREAAGLTGGGQEGGQNA